MVRLSGCLVGGGDIQDTVGINVEGNLDPRDTTGSRGDTGQLELSEKAAVLGAGTLTLVNLDKYTGLVVGVGGDEGSNGTTSGLDTRGNVEKKNQILSLLGGITGDDGGLNCGTISDDLIGVGVLARLLSVEKSETSLKIRGIRVEPPTETISSTLALLILESRRTFLTGSRVLRKRSWHNSSKRARVREV